MPDPFDTRGRGLENTGAVTGRGAERAYKCPSCQTFQTLKSNQAVLEEYARLGRLYRKKFFASCQTASCVNCGLPVHLAPKSYRSFGKTAAGDPRTQCKACKKTFSLGKPTRRHKKTHETISIFKALTNKTSISRLTEMLDVTPAHIYSKIDFLNAQVLKFANRRETDLGAALAGKSVVFATDAQVLTVNWPARERRGIIPFLHLCTVHQGSQYVLASTLDYDPDISTEEVDNYMESVGDFDRPLSMRSQARLWSKREYERSVMSQNATIISQDDLWVGNGLKLPGTGCRVRPITRLMAI